MTIWVSFTTLFSALCDRLEAAADAESQQPEVKQAWMDWRAAAEDIAIACENRHRLERVWQTRLLHDDVVYTMIVTDSVNALSPLFDGRFCEVKVNLSYVLFSSRFPLLPHARFLLVPSFGGRSSLNFFDSETI